MKAFRRPYHKWHYILKCISRRRKKGARSKTWSSDIIQERLVDTVKFGKGFKLKFEGRNFPLIQKSLKKTCTLQFPHLLNGFKSLRYMAREAGAWRKGRLTKVC